MLLFVASGPDVEFQGALDIDLPSFGEVAGAVFAGASVDIDFQEGGLLVVDAVGGAVAPVDGEAEAADGLGIVGESDELGIAGEASDENDLVEGCHGDEVLRLSGEGVNEG